MRIKSIILSVALLLGLGFSASADKGMWLLNELNKQNLERMRELGFNLTFDQLYNPGQEAVASSVVIFGNGCTGVTVSNQALIFTNHHCGFGAIQSQSSVDHDYLRDGFSAKELSDELPIPGLEVRYLKDIVDVTERVEKEVAGLDEEARTYRIAEMIENVLVPEYSKGEFVEARVAPFYAGNKYYVLIYNVFKDVRMVMAPPSSVGKFGGDTDNWMWPRHTGDFSVFRVYANANNEAANYSKENRPYQPISYAKISLDGYQPKSFAMTIGFPGSTDRYLTSWGIENVMQNENEPRIEVRGIKQGIWMEAMKADQATRIKYATKYAHSANYWKNSIGMNRGLKKLQIVARKQAEEKAFTEWAQKEGNEKYASILPSLKEAYTTSGKINKELNYVYESLFGGTEIIRLARMAQAITYEKDDKIEAIDKKLENKYKDYLPSLDKKVLPAMLDIVRKHLSKESLPSIFTEIDQKFEGSTQLYADYIFANSIVPYIEKMNETLHLNKEKRDQIINNDPAVLLAQSAVQVAVKLQEQTKKEYFTLEKGKREYFAANRLMDPERQMPSDANFTMRMSYGSVGGYAPSDGAWYKYYTTEKGIFEKQDPDSYEFAVQPEILELLKSKDFGPYAENGELRLCFLSNNDITGGNSGSPVFDGNGNLIALAFDGNWEAMSGDLEFEPNLQRTICVDIRYVMFMIDKWAKNQRLVNEVTFIKTPQAAKSCCKSKALRGCAKAKACCDKEKAIKRCGGAKAKSCCDKEKAIKRCGGAKAKSCCDKEKALKGCAKAKACCKGKKGACDKKGGC